jgi:hypothetical protein
MPTISQQPRKEIVVSDELDFISAGDVEAKGPPSCPTCGEPMHYYGGSAGRIHHEWKILRFTRATAGRWWYLMPPMTFLKTASSVVF